MNIDVNMVRQKLQAVQTQIRHLQASDFPYDDSQLALRQLYVVLERQAALIQEAVDGGTAEEILRACRSANAKIAEIHPLMSILLRSTNVRNSFEIYEPLLSLARKLLPKDAHLVLSSEWAFSPFTYPSASEDLKSFVLIGLPASGAHNALIVPTAGHELGHSIWAHTSIGRDLRAKVNETVVNQFLKTPAEFERIFGKKATFENLFKHDDILANLTLSCRIATRQSEEIFCDVVGVYLFANAFIHAFDYLLWPSLGEYRSEYYPPITRRREYMQRVALKCGYKPRRDDAASWLEQEKPLPAISRFAVSMADTACDILFEEISERAITHCENNGVS